MQKIKHIGALKIQHLYKFTNLFFAKVVVIIREWSPQHDRMSRGITLNEQEMRMILDLLRRRERRVPRGRTRPSQEREEFVPRREPVRETGNETVSAAESAEANADLAASPQAAAEAPVPEGMTRTDEESWEGPVPEAKPESESE